MTDFSWEFFEHLVLQKNAHQKILVPYFDVPDPSSVGYEESSGEPEGQSADWRRVLPDGRGIHIQEFAYNYYLIHWDRFSPNNPLGHLLADSPEVPAALVSATGTGWAVGDFYYQRVKDTSKHPVRDSVLISLGTAIASGLATYFVGKAIREYCEDSSSAKAERPSQVTGPTGARRAGRAYPAA